MTFFATTLQAVSFTRKNFVNNLTLHSLNFRFPSYSRRMLQDSSPPRWTKVFVSNTGTSRIINNTFYGTDGMALEYNGVDNLVENNLFEFNDWTGNNMDVATGGNPSFFNTIRSTCHLCSVVAFVPGGRGFSW